jgi:hypothetical protein
MPEDNADLASFAVEFEQLDPNTAETCPISLEDIVDYLRCESPDGDAVQTSELDFLRTALVADHRYWIWSFRESDGSDCFVTVALSPDGTRCIGYDENDHGLTPEQFMLGEYHQVF